MNLSGNTILITGGTSGIGYALAERFFKTVNQVIICGRRAQMLQEVQQKMPGLVVRVCDVSQEEERLSLLAWANKEFPKINVLVNNAGIQRKVNLLQTTEMCTWSYYNQEIATNLEAPIHLAMLFVPSLSLQDNAAILNVSSGLAFTPLAAAPIYSATKAALHSFSMTLRHQLIGKAEVIEIAPPAVNTDLGGVGLHTFGIPRDEFADAVFDRLKQGKIEIGIGTSEKAIRMSRDEIDAVFQMINNR
jgi:uncharacterized oxidoreductase